jgi:KRAB domain-containing zinc finger protein
MPKAIYRQPEGKIVQCRICDANFKHIYEIRNHLNLHLDVNTFDAIDLQTKDFLFDPHMAGVANETKESLISYITNEIAGGGNKARLYDIFNRSNGQELNLTDSETESETESAPVESVDHQFSGFRYTQRKHQCSICKESFDRIYKIMHHLTDTHASDADGFKDRCDICNKVFPNEFILNRHRTTQCGNLQKLHECEGCKMKFMWADNLKLHRKQCPELSPKEKCRSGQGGELTCELCQKTFQRYEYLKRHMQTHLPNERKFECPECQKKFNRKDNLRSHLKTHSKDPELPMPDGQLCVYCGRNFSNSSNLIVHMRRHTGKF